MGSLTNLQENQSIVMMMIVIKVTVDCLLSHKGRRKKTKGQRKRTFWRQRRGDFVQKII